MALCACVTYCVTKRNVHVLGNQVSQFHMFDLLFIGQRFVFTCGTVHTIINEGVYVWSQMHYSVIFIVKSTIQTTFINRIAIYYNVQIRYPAF